MRVVLDTNVVVSGLLNPHGPPGRIIDGVLAGHLVVLVDDRIIDEYRLVLSRPKFGFDKADRGEFLSFLGSQAERVLAKPLLDTFPDPDDVCFLEVALAGDASALVTGNVKHFPPALTRGMTVLAPSQFLEAWRRAQP